jgi:hypothetical protein
MCIYICKANIMYIFTVLILESKFLLAIKLQRNIVNNKCVNNITSNSKILDKEII